MISLNTNNKNPNNFGERDIHLLIKDDQTLKTYIEGNINGLNIMKAKFKTVEKNAEDIETLTELYGDLPDGIENHGAYIQDLKTRLANLEKWVDVLELNLSENIKQIEQTSSTLTSFLKNFEGLDLPSVDKNIGIELRGMNARLKELEAYRNRSFWQRVKDIFK